MSASFGTAADEDDIIGLDVAVTQPVGVERAERFGEGKAEREAFVGWQAAPVVKCRAQSARRVGGRVC